MKVKKWKKCWMWNTLLDIMRNTVEQWEYMPDKRMGTPRKFVVADEYTKHNLFLLPLFGKEFLHVPRTIIKYALKCGSMGVQCALGNGSMLEETQTCFGQVLTEGKRCREKCFKKSLKGKKGWMFSIVYAILRNISGNYKYSPDKIF